GLALPAADGEPAGLEAAVLGAGALVAGLAAATLDAGAAGLETGATDGAALPPQAASKVKPNVAPRAI
ncbi:MAG TPA: serine protease, partial [Chloroflexota bacterium]|nr:serine protease [Chloroflexota bacterium]